MILKEEITDESIFLLPLYFNTPDSSIITDKKNLNIERYGIRFVNAYSDNFNIGKSLPNQLFVLFGLPLSFKERNRIMKEADPSAIKFYIFEKKYYICYQLNCNNKFEKDVIAIKENRWIDVSQDTIIHIIQFWGKYADILKKVLNKFDNPLSSKLIVNKIRLTEKFEKEKGS